MALTPADPRHFLPRNGHADLQAHVVVDQYAEQAVPREVPTVGSEEGKLGDENYKPPTYADIVEELRNLKAQVPRVNARATGLKSLWVEWLFSKYWNPAMDAIEEEVGHHVLSDPSTNLLVNGFFRQFSGTVPNGWTATGTATTGSDTARTGSLAGNNALAITTTGATGGMQQSVALFKPGAIMHLSFWCKVSGGSATVRVLSNGATPYDSGTITLAASVVGTGAWFMVPGLHIQGFPFAFEVPSDATTLTVTLAAATNSTCYFSDVVLGLGPLGMPDMAIPSPSDVETLPNVETFGIVWQTASAIAADQNDYAPGTGSAWRISTSGSVQTITGMSLSQTDGQELHLRNVGSAGIVLAHQSASSAAANRFLNFNGYDLFLPADAIVTYKYDSTTSRWVGVS